MRYSMFHRSENYSEIQGPSLVNFLEVEQIYSCVDDGLRHFKQQAKKLTRSRMRWRGFHRKEHPQPAETFEKIRKFHGDS